MKVVRGDDLAGTAQTRIYRCTHVFYILREPAMYVLEVLEEGFVVRPQKSYSPG